MIDYRNLAGLAAAAAYAAGHLGLLSAGGATALAQTEQEIPPEWQAAIEAATPGEHHHHLNALVGDWAGKFKIRMEPGGEAFVSEGTISREWALGGRFLKETVNATSDMGTFQAIAYLGYNNLDGRYEFVWLEDHSTAMYFETGHYDPAAKSLRTRGSHRDPRSGQVVATRGVVDMSDPDRHVYTGYATGPDGREYKSFEGVAERK